MRLIIVLLAFTLSVSAKIGETKKQCEAKYGKPMKRPKGHPTNDYLYKLNGWSIQCAFDKKGICTNAFFTNGKIMTDKKVKEIIKFNCPDAIKTKDGWRSKKCSILVRNKADGPQFFIMFAKPKKNKKTNKLSIEAVL